MRGVRIFERVAAIWLALILALGAPVIPAFAESGEGIQEEAPSEEALTEEAADGEAPAQNAAGYALAHAASEVFADALLTQLLALLSEGDVVYLSSIDPESGAAIVLVNLNGEAVSGFVEPDALNLLDDDQATRYSEKASQNEAAVAAGEDSEVFLLPLTAALGFLGLAIVGSLAALIAFESAFRAVQRGVMRPARETLFTTVSREERYKAKAFIDTFVYRVGDVVGAQTEGLLGRLGMGLAALAAFAVPLAVAWMALGLWLGHAQRAQARGEERTEGAVA